MNLSYKFTATLKTIAVETKISVIRPRKGGRSKGFQHTLHTVLKGHHLLEQNQIQHKFLNKFVLCKTNKKRARLKILIVAE